LSRYRRGGEVTRATSRPQDRRRGNRIFYAVAEGEGTEYDYLGYLNQFYGSELRFLIRSPSQRHGLSPSRVVDEAGRAIGEPGVEAWALFDHDGRPNIDQVCARASRQRIKVALSHPSFELWLLLHFQDFAPAAQGGSNNVIMERLRAAHPAFANYRDGNKRIDARRFDALNESGNIRRAVERSRRLASDFIHETASNRDPATDVHLLIERLGIVRRPR
jgi:RloB-like protein